MNVVFPNSIKKYMKLQCNNSVSDYTECPELRSIYGFLGSLSPGRVLDIGSGIGRASVYLRNEFEWRDTDFYLLDGDCGDTQVAGIHPKVSDDFYNSLKATKEFCLANNIAEERLFLVDATKPLPFESETFDLCYSLKSIGFHWPIDEHLDKLYKPLKTGAYILFELRSLLASKYPNHRWKRINDFVQRQISAVDLSKYVLIRYDSKADTPVLILQKK
jgi:SAM-dependent methyltransferase